MTFSPFKVQTTFACYRNSISLPLHIPVSLNMPVLSLYLSVRVSPDTPFSVCVSAFDVHTSVSPFVRSFLLQLLTVLECFTGAWVPKLVWVRPAR